MNRILLISFVVLLIACNSVSERVLVVTSPGKEVFLKGESLGMAEMLTRPSRIYYWDSLLYMMESTDDYKMIVCDPSGGGVVNKLIPEGRGPGEQIGTFFFAYDQESRKLYSFDITLRRILELNCDSIAIPLYQPKKTYAIPASLSIFHGAFLRDFSFVVSGNNPDFRVAIYTPGGEINKFGDSPDVRQNINAIVNEAYMGVMKVAPAGDKFVITCRHADQLEIFTLGNSRQLFVKGPELFEPSYSVKSMGSYKALAHKNDELCGYTDVCVTDDRIYALYSGKLDGTGAMYCNTIRVFSWTGEYLMDYVLERGVLAFALDDNEKCFYGIVSEPGAEIYRFNLIENEG